MTARPPVDGNVVVTPHGAWQFKRPGGRLHGGIDLRAPLGTPIYAPEDGDVFYSVAGNAVKPLSGFGPACVVVLGKETGHWHTLGHLDAGSLVYGNAQTSGIADPIQVPIKAGELVGTTGPHRNGAHLHWTVAVYKPGQAYRRAQRINPLGWLNVFAPGVRVAVRPGPSSQGVDAKWWLLLALLLASGR